MCGPRSSLSALLLLLCLGSNENLLCAQEMSISEAPRDVSSTPLSREVTASQSGDVLMSQSGDVLTLSSDAGEGTSPEKTTLAVGGTTFGDLVRANTAMPATSTAESLTKPEPEDQGTTKIGTISTATSAAKATVMLTTASIQEWYSATMTRTSTAMLADVGASTKLYETTRELAVSQLTTSTQAENNGEETDTLSSTTESIYSSSKPPSPTLTNPLMTPSPPAPVLMTAPTTVLSATAVTASEAVSTPLAPTVKTASGGAALTTGSKTTRNLIGPAQASTHASETTYTANDTIPGSNVQPDRKEHDTKASPMLVLIAVITGAMLGTAVCVLMFVTCRKKRRSQSRHINGWGQRSNMKKGADDDAWAGPVMMEGGEKAGCEGLEEGPGPGADNNTDGTDGTLSTFVALEENGVGRDGSKEAQKWEEQEPLLYIDEDVKREGKEKEGEEKAGSKVKGGRSGNTETQEAELNGETFCLTTAV